MERSKLHNEELHNLFSSCNYTVMIKSRFWWVRHDMGRRKYIQYFDLECSWKENTGET